MAGAGLCAIGAVIAGAKSKPDDGLLLLVIHNNKQMNECALRRWRPDVWDQTLD